jgi:hypothetical protein
LDPPSGIHDTSPCPIKKLIRELRKPLGDRGYDEIDSASFLGQKESFFSVKRSSKTHFGKEAIMNYSHIRTKSSFPF